MKKRLGHWLFGRVEFLESEEYLQFQYRFLCIVMLSGSAFTALFVVADLSGANPLFAPEHVAMMSFYAVLGLVVLAWLRGHKRRVIQAAWIYEMACLVDYMSAAYFVPADELRVLWFYTNIPGVYILLGQRAGLAVTAVMTGVFLFGNA